MCKAVPPSSPSSSLSSRVVTFICNRSEIKENVRIGPFLGGTVSSISSISNWPDG